MIAKFSDNQGAMQNLLSDQRQWFDFRNSEIVELERICDAFQIPKHWTEDAMQSEHLPKYETGGTKQFFILRAYAPDCPDVDADTVGELTRKIAVILTPNAIVTVHRTPMDWLSQLQQRASQLTQEELFFELLKGAIHSYEAPIEAALSELDDVEDSTFEPLATSDARQAYLLKRKASVFRKMLRLTLDLFSRWAPSVPVSLQPQLQDFREQIEELYFYADELLESSQMVLNLQIALASQRTNEASHRTNEVMRILTIFSVFFLPLNFIAGIYGMNFEHMPELKSPLGYPMVLLFMLTVVAGILFWFRSRKWL